MKRAVFASFLIVVSGAVMRSQGAGTRGFTPVTDAMLRNQAPGDWLRWRRDHGATGYSPLDQIDRSNVGKLRLAWSWAMEPGPQEPEPIVHAGIMYLPHSHGVVQALDARTGDLIWEYKRDFPKDAQADDTVRNVAIYGDKIFVTTQDAHLVALQATTGKIVWDVQTADYKKRVNYSAGPIAADGKVFAATTCSGGTPPCFVSAHDVETGKQLWRRESVAGPTDPKEHQDTWSGLPYAKRQKASMWLTGSYDPDLKLLYWTTASPWPYPELHKGTKDGTLLYSNSLLALDSATGAIKWFFQMEPRDNFDMDHQDNPILADVPTAGRAARKLVFTLGKPGILWAFDRATGRHTWNSQLVATQNIYSRIDPETGAITMNTEIIAKKVGVKQLVCPGMRGGKLFQTHAYSPKTKALYSPVSNACTNFEIVPLEVSASGVNYDKISHMEGANGNVGRLVATSADTGKILWKHDQRAAMGSVLTTGGNLVFAGDFYRYFRAFDAENGKVLWEIPLGAPVTGYPISYAVGGKQYVGVGVGGGTSGQRNLNQLYPELKSPNGGNVLMVFALP